MLGGASHTHGGTQWFGMQGQWFGEAEAGEAIINKRSTALYLPLLSAINQAGGGRALVGSLPTVNFAALGAITAPVARE